MKPRGDFVLFGRKWVARTIVLFLAIFLFYMGWVNFTEPTEMGLVRNHISGDMWIQEEGGIHFTPPWVGVARIDLRPMRVAVVSAGHGYSGKLVQFDKLGWREFVAAEGWHYYWWYNRFSINLGYAEEYRGMRDIMRGYAYGAKQYPFMVLLEEYQTR